MLRPMIVAPMLACDSSTTGVLYIAILKRTFATPYLL